METCISIVKATGEVCGRKCLVGELCGTHFKSENRVNVQFGERLPTQCWHCHASRRCEREITNNETRRCDQHNQTVLSTRLSRKLKRIALVYVGRNMRTREAILEVLPRLMVGGDLYDPVFTQVDAYTDQIPLRIFDIRVWRVPDAPIFAYYNWVLGGQVAAPPAEPAPPPPPAWLGRIAQDKQNVHTQVITRQTNDMVDTLMKIDVSENVRQRCIETMAWKWMDPLLGLNYVRASWVIQDVHKWFITETCRAPSDWFYKKLLLRVVEKIVSTNDEETQRELWKRLYEECSEAKGMCCDGHISRLCNVFVGFDENFKGDIPIGERLQNAIAMIVEETKDVTTRVERAKNVFDELKVPQLDREVWLEALVEA